MWLKTEKLVSHIVVRGDILGQEVALLHSYSGAQADSACVIFTWLPSHFDYQ